MKIKLIITLSIVFISFQGFTQTNFEWTITDTIDKTKSEIYGITKMFIAESWKSAQDVVQLDDKETGVILIKGAAIRKVQYMMGEYTYIYNYTLTFRMKENRYKITLDDVYCQSAFMTGGSDITKIQPFEGDNCPPTGTFAAPGLPKKKAVIMMSEFKEYLQSIMDMYPIYLQSKSVADDW